MERLLQKFQELKVSKSTVYNFVRTECNLSLKKTQFQPVDKNSEKKKIQKRFDRVHKWECTDMDFRTNCAFLDESAFHINLKRSMAWSKKGLPAVVTVPKTRAQTTTILGAISASGLIKCSLRLPQPPAIFLKATMDEMDRYPHMKRHYLITDNAPIHKFEDIAKYIISRGYRYAYLPSYSPELNPIEQFWSVVKSKVKRNRLLEKETLMTRISEASNSLKVSDFKGFVRYSYKCLAKCRNREHL
ncbi:hypothetical protein RMATCC62417_12822 [Rhizopus microsporus]|nr:hypothetical protein RMATCC62417_12822 [Rhizopus microsporus]